MGDEVKKKKKQWLQQQDEAYRLTAWKNFLTSKIIILKKRVSLLFAVVGKASKHKFLE